MATASRRRLSVRSAEMRTRVLSIAAVLALIGCQRNEPRPEPAPTTTAVAPLRAKRDVPLDVNGITVTFRADGTVAIQGRDQFGTALDTVYENVDFFRNALPVLERSLTAAQATGLRDLQPPAGR